MVYDEAARSNVVMEAPAYQVKGLEKFLKSLPHEADHEIDHTKQYIYDNDEIELDNDVAAGVGPEAIIFSINTFNYKKMGLQGTYDDFYQLNNHNGKTFYLSYNKDVLYGFCGWVNRIST
jgi:hypothetical protein